MPDHSIDSVVTDPPYELGFMGKSWDSSGISYRVELWAECLRLLKPGGHLLAFGGSRTYHRLACAVEDAGFEIRDQIMWVYGSGFPKSHNISKAIDRAAGAEREAIGSYSGATNIGKKTDGKQGYGRTEIPSSGVDRTVYITKPSTDLAKKWDGWGTALKPSHEPIVLARKQLESTVAQNVLTYGTGGLNVDGCRVGEEQMKQAVCAGRWPANFIHDGSEEVLGLFPEVGHSSAARFFYCSKAPLAEREAGLTGDSAASRRNHHPTVKPFYLMRHLVRLATPPGGIVLDPFAGSGTTGVAAVYERMRFVGIEQLEDYAKIAASRISHHEEVAKCAGG
jgi:site-specific DNA-methyltransferase (adenine-specific)